MAEPREREADRLREAYQRRPGEHAAVPSRLASPGDLYIIQERERMVAGLLRATYPTGLGELRILDFGCGTGAGMHELLALGARPERVVGVDLLASRLVRARRLLPAVALARANGTALPLRAGCVDLALQYTAFSSILDPEIRREAAGELKRVLRPGGVLLWYDLRVDNPRNPDVRRITRAELRGLFPGWRVEARSLTLAPPLVRLLAPASWLAAALAGSLPFLRTHLLARLVKPA